MKSLVSKVIMASLLAATSTAFAVETAKCPTSLSISLENIETVEDSKLVFEPWAFGDDVLYVKSIRDALGLVSVEQIKAEKLLLAKKSNGICTYLSENANDGLLGQSVAHTRLYTSQGRNILRLAIPVTSVEIPDDKLEYVWTYLNVTQYDQSGISTAPVRGSSILGFLDHGSPRITVGWAKGLEVK